MRTGSYSEKGWSKLRKYHSSVNGEMFANDIRMFLKPLTSITTEGFFLVFLSTEWADRSEAF